MALSKPRRPGFNIEKLYGFFLVLFIVISSALFFGRVPLLIQRLVSPFQVTQGEAFKVEFGRILIRGESLYPDPTQGPYLYSDYPPFFPALEALPQYFGYKNPWLPGRLFAFMGYLGSALGLVAWGWMRWPKKSAVALTLLFLLSPTWSLWGSMARADCLMIFTTFCAYLLLDFDEKEKPGGKKGSKTFLVVAAGLLTALAFFLKQNAALLALAYSLHCLLLGKWKKLLFFLIPFLVSVVALSSWLQWVTKGQYLNYTFFWIPLGYNPQWFLDLFKDSFIPECGWLAAAVIVTWVTRPNSHLIRCQTAFSILWLLGLGRAGGAESFYLEFTLYGIFFLGEGWAGKRRASSGPIPLNSLLMERILFSSFLVLGLFFFGRGSIPGPPSLEEKEAKTGMLPIYSGGGEHLALDADLLVMANKKVWLQPMEFTQLVENGRWSPQYLLEDIRKKKFASIELYDIPRQYLLPEIVVNEIERNYHVFLREYGRLWFKPNG